MVASWALNQQALSRLPTVGSGAYEIRIRRCAGAFRVVYVAKFEESGLCLARF